MVEVRDVLDNASLPPISSVCVQCSQQRVGWVSVM